MLSCILGVVIALTATESSAQADYPSRPIRLVATSAAGGTGDTLGRAIAKLVERDLNTTIVVDNRPGATGIIAKTRNLLYGTSGAGNPIHFMTEALSQRAGITMTHVPYKGLAPAVIALISGEVQVLLAPPITTRPHIAAGRMRVLGSVGSKRVSAMPDVPTMEELGFKGFTLLGGWQGWFAPAKTPPAIVAKLNRAAVKAAASEALRGLMQDGGYVPDSRSPAEFRALVLADYKRFSELARTANIKEE